MRTHAYITAKRVGHIHGCVVCHACRGVNRAYVCFPWMVWKVDMHKHTYISRRNAHRKYDGKWRTHSGAHTQHIFMYDMVCPRDLILFSRNRVISCIRVRRLSRAPHWVCTYVLNTVARTRYAVYSVFCSLGQNGFFVLAHSTQKNSTKKKYFSCCLCVYLHLGVRNKSSSDWQRAALEFVLIDFIKCFP